MNPLMKEECGVRKCRIDPRVERTRQVVIGATCELLAERGLEGTTVHAIADRAGVNKTTIYRNWPEPLDLIHGCLTTLRQIPEVPNSGNLRNDLIKLFRRLASGLQRPPWDRLLPSLIGAAVLDDRTRDYHSEFVRSRRDLAAGVIEQAITRGELATSARPNDLVEAIAGPLYYRILMTKEPVSPSQVDLLVDRGLAWFAAP